MAVLDQASGDLTVAFMYPSLFSGVFSLHSQLLVRSFCMGLEQKVSPKIGFYHKEV